MFVFYILNKENTPHGKTYGVFFMGGKLGFDGEIGVI